MAGIPSFVRNAVPLNIILPANRPEEPIFLPVLLTQDVVLEKLQAAGPSDPSLAAYAQAP